MQFICESCKAHLLVADDKIRGKRLIVRCKRCGVQIRIVDPALASQSTAGPPTGPLRGASAPAPLSPSSQAGARPPSGPIRGGSIARASAPRRETDIESTRAMDSEVLEKAVRASKEGEPAPGPRIAPPPPPPREPPPPRDPAVWFAMIQGQQIGPMSRAELGTKASAGQVGRVPTSGRKGWSRGSGRRTFPSSSRSSPRRPRRRRRLTTRRGRTPGSGGWGCLSSRRFATPPVTGRASRAAEDPARAGIRLARCAHAPRGVALATGGCAGRGRAARGAGGRRSRCPGRLAARGARPGAVGRAELSKPRAETPAPHPKAVAPPAREFGIGHPERRGPLRAVLAILAVAAARFARRLRAPLRPEGCGSGACASGRLVRCAGARASARSRAQAGGEVGGACSPGAHGGAHPGAALAQGRREQARAAGCVDEALKRDPSLQVGKILISTTIAPSGAVASARIDQKAVDQSPLGTCLKNATRKLQFPPFAGEAFAVDIPVVVTGAP